MNFEIVGQIEGIETIAKGPSVRERKRLAEQFGRGRWRKLKGNATVKLRDGSTGRAEVLVLMESGVEKSRSSGSWSNL